MSVRLVVLSLVLVSMIGIPVSAQTAIEKYQMAMEHYQASRFGECRDLLLSIESQLGGPKLKTTTFIIMSMYKSNAFDSREILSRIDTYKLLSSIPDALSDEIKSIESTIKTWKAEFDARIDSIIKGRDLTAAREQAGKNYKMTDYNVIHKSLFQELNALRAELGGGVPVEEDRTKILAVKRIAERSAHGFEIDAKTRLTYLDNALVKKIASADYPDTWLAIHRELFGQTANSITLDSGRAARLAKVAAAQAAKQKELDSRRAYYFKMAQEEMDRANGFLVLGSVSVAVTGAYSAYLLSKLSTLGSTQEMGTLDYLLGAMAIPIYAFVAMRIPSDFRKYSYYSKEASRYIDKANRVSFNIVPTLQYDGGMDFKPGIEVAFHF